MRSRKRSHRSCRRSVSLMSRPFFIRAADILIPLAAVEEADLSEIDQLRLTVRHGGRTTVIEGVPAIEAVMALKPTALEGRRMRWVRHAWALHNLVGHPLMQLLALFRRHDLALRVHDATAPRPVEPVRSPTDRLE